METKHRTFLSSLFDRGCCLFLYSVMYLLYCIEDYIILPSGFKYKQISIYYIWILYQMPIFFAKLPFRRNLLTCEYISLDAGQSDTDSGYCSVDTNTEFNRNPFTSYECEHENRRTDGHGLPIKSSFD
jgi:hypothetical protein